MTFLHRLHELLAYPFQVGSAAGFELVLPGCGPRCELFIGDGAFQPMGEIAAFKMVFEHVLVEMS